MITRGRAGIVKPNPRYALSSETTPATTVISLIPSSARAALKDPNWRAAMEREFAALQSNQTWRLVDRPPHSNIVTGKWVLSINSNLMDRWKDTKHARSFAASPNALAWTLTKRSRRSSNLPQFRQCSPLQHLVAGLPNNLMYPMPSCMVILRNMFSVSSLRDSKTPRGQRGMSSRQISLWNKASSPLLVRVLRHVRTLPRVHSDTI